MRHRSGLSLALGLVLTLAACDVPSGPRELPSPRLDPHAPFTGDGRAVASEDGQPGAEDSFEERLRRRGDAARPDSDQPATISVQRIALGGGLTAELPQRQQGWNWSRNGDLTLVAHGEAADTLIYTQSFPDLARRRPSAALNRFYLGVDRRLASTWIGGAELAPLVTRAAAGLPMSPSQIRRAMELSLTPSLGRGLGYTSDRDSFTGWRWLGRNAGGTYLRLGRTTGTWGAQDPLPEAVEELLGLLADGSPDLAGLLWDAPQPAAAPGRAWMVVGSAQRDDGSGVHLAVLCRLRPRCTTAPDLARFLDSVAPAAGEPLASGGEEGFTDLTQRLGIALYGGKQALDLAALQQAVVAMGAGNEQDPVEDNSP